MLLCSGCGMQMRPQQGACPDCGVSYGFGMGARDAPEMSEAKTEEEPTSDFKLDKIGRKIKASKIIFNKGEDDSTKKVQENMKPTFKDITTALAQMRSEALQPEIDEATAPWETDAEAAKREKEASNFKKPNNPARSGMETAKALAQRGLKKASANEELKGKQHKIDKNKNGKLDKHDFKLLRKEDAEQMDEEMHPEADKVLKHIKPEHHDKYKPDLAKGIYKGDFADRTAVLKAAKNAGHLKEDLDEVDMPLNESYDPADYEASHEKSQFGGHRAKLTNKKTGKVSYLGATGYHKPEHAKGEAEAYRTSYNHSGKSHPGATYSHDKAISAYRKKAKEAGHIAEANAFHMKESVFDWKNNPRETKDKTKTSTYHDVKKISTGTVYTKQFDKDGTSKGTGDDAAKKAEGAVKRGRGRPKKDKFAESVEMLMSLSEDQFDSMMEEGFDAFFEAYEQLDELSKTTLGDYAKKASRESTINRKIAADFEHMGDKARSPGMKQAAGVNAQHYKVKSWKRRDGADKAIDKLTK